VRDFVELIEKVKEQVFKKLKNSDD